MSRVDPCEFFDLDAQAPCDRPATHELTTFWQDDEPGSGTAITASYCEEHAPPEALRVRYAAAARATLTTTCDAPAPLYRPGAWPTTEEPTMITLTIETITPDQAAKILGDAEENGFFNARLLRPHRVDLYAKQMAAGEWQVTGEPICFDEYGNPTNGQHRLRACVAAGIPFTTAIARGITEAATRVTDKGMARTPGDVARQSGITAANEKMGVARVILSWEANVLGNQSATRLFTDKEKIDLLESDPELADAAITAARMILRNVRIPVRMYGAFYWLAAHHGDSIDLFTKHLGDGAALPIDSPILALRNWSTNRAMNKITTRDPEWALALAKSWNRWRAEEPMRLLKVVISGKGANRTPIPDLV